MSRHKELGKEPICSAQSRQAPSLRPNPDAAPYIPKRHLLAFLPINFLLTHTQTGSILFTGSNQKIATQKN